MIQSRRQKYGFLAFCIVPALLLFLIVTIYPLGYGLYMSFFKWSGASSNREFIGLANYARLFSDKLIPVSIYNDYFLVVVKMVFIMLLALLFAVALTQMRIREAAVYRFVFFFPNIMPVASMAILWLFIFSAKMGLLNGILDGIGLDTWTRAWLGSRETALPSMSAPLIWAGVGLNMLLFMGAIGNIPSTVYEAAELDGVVGARRFLHITMPLIWPQFKTALIYLIITTLNGSYVLVQLMTQGGPANATLVMGSYLYQQAFVHYNFGYGATIGMMILVITFATVLVMQRLLRRDDVEY